MADKKDSGPMISPGSMLNSSEGLLSTGAMAALVQVATTTDSEGTACCACLGLAVVAATYAIVRGKAKAEA